jgi:hypothetical protein
MPGAVDPSRHGLLVVNHEYTNEELMFPGLGRQDVKLAAFAGMTEEIVAVEMAAHGGSVIEVKREDGAWRVIAGSKYARRIDADTVMEITGPAAGHARRGAQPQALRHARQLVRLGQVARALRRRQGAERGEPLRLDRRDRSLRPRFDAAQTHSARPHEARRRLRAGQPRRPRRRLHGRR